MPYKVCASCNQTSYSAAERGIWHCPHCGADITFCESFSRPLQPRESGPEHRLSAYLRRMHSQAKE